MFAAFAVLFYRSLRYRRYLVGYKRGKYNFTDILSLNKMGWMVGLQMGLETALFSITGIMIGWKHCPGRPSGDGGYLDFRFYDLLRSRSSGICTGE